MRRLLGVICHRRQAAYHPSTSLAGVCIVEVCENVKVEADITIQYRSRLQSVRHLQSVLLSQRIHYDRMRLPRASAALQASARDRPPTSRATETHPMPRLRARSAAYDQAADMPPEYAKEERRGLRAQHELSHRRAMIRNQMEKQGSWVCAKVLPFCPLTTAPSTAYTSARLACKAILAIESRITALRLQRPGLNTLARLIRANPATMAASSVNRRETLLLRPRLQHCQHHQHSKINKEELSVPANPPVVTYLSARNSPGYRSHQRNLEARPRGIDLLLSASKKRCPQARYPNSPAHPIPVFVMHSLHKHSLPPPPLTSTSNQSMLSARLLPARGEETCQFS